MAKPLLMLGTAMWKWSADRAAAFDMLELFVAAGGKLVDSAGNYPINRDPADFSVASLWLAEWLAVNGTGSVGVMMKLGAMDNLGGGEANLVPSFLEVSEEIYRGRFGAALKGLAVHWDNRTDGEAIAATVEVFRRWKAVGIEVGFSGVKAPELYLKAAPELAEAWWIQVKENALTQAAREGYQKYFPKAKYWAYGMNMGGVKDVAGGAGDSVTLRGVVRPEAVVAEIQEFMASSHGLMPAPKTMNEFALMRAFANPNLAGVVIGPRTVEQLRATLDYWQRLNEEWVPGTIVPELGVRHG